MYSSHHDCQKKNCRGDAKGKIGAEEVERGGGINLFRETLEASLEWLQWWFLIFCVRGVAQPG